MDIHSSVDGHSGCCHFLAITNNALNIRVQLFLWTCVFISLEWEGVELLDHMVTMFN